MVAAKFGMVAAKFGLACARWPQSLAWHAPDGRTVVAILWLLPNRWGTPHASVLELGLRSRLVAALAGVAWQVPDSRKVWPGTCQSAAQFGLACARWPQSLAQLRWMAAQSPEGSLISYHRLLTS